jgi:peptidoglycan hydrolase FlgJ
MAAITPPMLSSAVRQDGLAIDARAVDGLRGRATSDPKGAVKDIAKQFEALFMHELLKSMRATTMSTGTLDNEGSKLGTEMLDAQLAQKMTGLPGGLSQAIERQLSRQMGLFPGPIPNANPPSANTSPLPLERIGKATAIPQSGAAHFVSQHQGAAQEAEKRTGIPAAFMISQAALETGWGRKEIRHSDGTPAFNLFGVKAGANWKGAVAEVATTEYVDGKPHKVMAKFRAYTSYAESFSDYVRLMAESPRYQRVAAASSDASGFARSLQRAGYATDPAYADKLTRVINTTLRLQRTVA